MASNKSGVFTLGDVGERQETSSWDTASDVWLLASPVIVRESPFGYVGGGYSPAWSGTTIDRIDYSNDTPTPTQKGSLVNKSNAGAAVGNLSFGYWGGGKGPAHMSIVQRLDYANDTTDTIVRGPLSGTRYLLSAVGNNNFGYFGGSYDPPGPYSTIDRIDYSNDTAAATPKGPLSQTRSAGAGLGNSDFGYLVGGYPGPSQSSRVDRIEYANDTPTTSIKGSLATGRYRLGATGNDKFGYVGGGHTPSSDQATIVERIDYSTDTSTAVAKGPLSEDAGRLSATGNSSSGYWSGGYNADSGTVRSYVRRIDYSNDTATGTTRGGLSVAKYYTMSASAAANALASNFIGTTSNIGVNRVPVGTNFGYTFGGYKPSPGYLSAVQRIDYSNDTATAPQTASLPNAMSNRATVGNTNYAYVQPGTGPAGTNMQRFDYSNDTSGTSAKGGVPEGHANYNTGNEDFGYFSVAHPETSVFRLEYASDTANALVRTYRTVSNQIYNGGAAGNSSYGYFAGGGQNGTAGGTVMDRIDYSNDTATMTVKGPLTSNQTYGIAANGSANFAYWGGGTGGSGPTPGARSTVDRLDYSSDTTATEAKGPLTIA